MDKDFEVMIEIYSKMQNNKASKADEAMFNILIERSCLRKDILLLNINKEYNKRIK